MLKSYQHALRLFSRNTWLLLLTAGAGLLWIYAWVPRWLLMRRI